MDSKLETMADAVTAMVEAFARSSSVAGGSCSEGCTDTYYEDSYTETITIEF